MRAFSHQALGLAAALAAVAIAPACGGGSGTSQSGSAGGGPVNGIVVRNNQVTGFQIEPDFQLPGKTNITKADSLAHFDNYRYNKVPAFLYKGVDVEKLAGLKTLQKDFLGNRIGKGFVGAVR